MSAVEKAGARTPAELAPRVRAEHEAAQSAFRSAVDHAILCGELLIEAKAQLPHGAFGDWIADNFPAGRRTAQGYMRLARAEDAQALAHLGIEGALKELAAPREVEETDDSGLVFLFDCGTPVPVRFMRTMDLMVERSDKQSWLDRHEWLHPPGDDQSAEAKLRWVAPQHEGRIESGHACRLATKVWAEITLIDAEIEELLGEVNIRELELRAAALAQAAEARIAELEEAA